MKDRKFERSVGHGCLLALGSREMGMSCVELVVGAQPCLHLRCWLALSPGHLLESPESRKPQARKCLQKVGL